MHGQFMIMSHFYSIPDDTIYDINYPQLECFCGRGQLYLPIEEYTNLPLKPIKVYNLSGTEEDFQIFDKILSEEDNYLCFYMCPSDREEFIMENLNPYINSRNAAIRGYNLNIAAGMIIEYKKWEDKIYR